MIVSDKKIQSLFDSLDGSGSDTEWAAITKLRKALGRELPRYLLEKFKKSSTWKVRSSCVYHATRYARESEAAITLGILALRDRSKVVRYRACMLLAYSLRRDLLPILRQAYTEVDKDSIPDVKAAIDAIESGNHNYFVDRDHSGNMTLAIH